MVIQSLDSTATISNQSWSKDMRITFKERDYLSDLQFNKANIHTYIYIYISL